MSFRPSGRGPVGSLQRAPGRPKALGRDTVPAGDTVHRGGDALDAGGAAGHASVSRSASSRTSTPCERNRAAKASCSSGARHPRQSVEESQGCRCCAVSARSTRRRGVQDHGAQRPDFGVDARIGCPPRINRIARRGGPGLIEHLCDIVVGCPRWFRARFSITASDATWDPALGSRPAPAGSGETGSLFEECSPPSRGGPGGAERDGCSTCRDWSRFCDLTAEPAPHPAVARLRRRLNDVYAGELGEPFTSAGFALCRDGSDSVAWHGDTIRRCLAPPPPDRPAAASSTRRPGGAAPGHHGRHRQPQGRPGCSRCGPGAGVLLVALGHGDLLVMGGSCQRSWERFPRRMPRRPANEHPVPAAQRALSPPEMSGATCGSHSPRRSQQIPEPLRVDRNRRLVRQHKDSPTRHW